MTKFNLATTPSVFSPVGPEQTFTLQSLCDLAVLSKAPTKEALKMVIGGEFDTTRARKNDNMLTVTCVFGDFDAGDMTPTEAYEKLKAANITGAIITSPRHKHEGMRGEGNRWRVAAPLSAPLPFTSHAALACRLNSVFGYGILGTEGLSASRPYYIGSVFGYPNCETYIHEGRTLDAASDIPEVPFPSSANEYIKAPVFVGDVTSEAIALGVLDAAANFSHGHEGLRPACTIIAPFVKIGALDIEEAAERLQEQLVATSSRHASDIPDGEALRTLEWACNSKVVTEKTAATGLKLQLDDITLAQATFGLALHYVDPIDDFGSLEPDEYEDGIIERAKRRAEIPILSVREVAEQDPPEWLIEGVLPKQCLGYLWGPPKHGKSFVALSMGMAVANGREWFGHTVHNTGLVYYIAGEGAAGARLRLPAACNGYGISEDVPFFTIPRGRLLTDDGEVEKLERAILDHAAGRTIAIVFVDTLARAIPGIEENSAKDMGEVVAR